MATYKKILKDGAKVQVESAIRDGEGVKISTNYAKKSEIPTNNNQLTNGAGYITGISSSDVTTALGYTPANSSNLGTASTKNTGTSEGNVPVLGTNGKLPSSVIPASAITDTFVVASQNAMLSLSNAEVGDVAVRTDLNKSFILKATPYSVLANWQELLTPTDAVTSVNGQTGAVQLTIPSTASDVGALPSSTKYGASLSVSGRSVQLKDQNGNNLGTAITTQDTTYESKSASSGGTAVSLVTTGEKYTWNNKSNFSGSYNDLTDKPTIPTVPTNVSAFTNDAGYTTNAGTITGVQLNGSTIASSGVANIQALPNYSLSIGSTNGGNPRQVLFCSVNYTNFDSNSGAYFKLGAMSGHGNGSSYTFVEDIFINVNYQGAVTCNVYKYVQSSVTLDNVARNYGDIFWTIDTTNKIVYFYILLGQYSSAQFTPGTKIGAAKAVTSANGIVQYTGTPTYYSSGTKVWATGNSTLYARLSDIPDTTNFIQQGGTLTAPLTLTGGDSATAGKIILASNGQITNDGTATLFGRSGSSLLVGHSSHALTMRGSATRPTYNGSNMAFSSDIPTSYVSSVNGSTGAITNVAKKPVLLWSNATPSSNFNPQTITLSSNLSNYSFALIEYNNTTSGNMKQSIIIKNNGWGQLFYNSTTSAGPFVAVRWVQYRSTTTLYFEDCWNAQGTSSESKDNSRLIPLRVLGIE